MDTKITKKRLGHLLSYDWLKIIGAAVAGILVWTLVFTTTATRIRPSQRFSVFNYTSNTSLNSTDYYKLETELIKNNVFSYEVLEINNNDLAASAEYAGTLLETRLYTDEGNVMFIADIEDKETEYKDEKDNVYYKTHLENFSSGSFSYYMADMSLEAEKGYFKSLEKYLSNFYGDWKDEKTLDEDKVKDAFLMRAKKNKDKRFKTSAEKKKGIEKDVERIEKYRDALENVYAYIAAGYIDVTKVVVEMPISQTETRQEERFAINICPNEETMGDLKKIVNYMVEYEDAEGKTKRKTAVKDMHLVFFDLKGVEDGFEYESLLFLDNLVASYCSELKK